MLFDRKVNLDEVAIGASCPIKRANIDADEKVRLCSTCDINVYNISNMTRKEAESLLESHSGRLCLRLYRRQDGTLITKDTPLGRRIADSFKRRAQAISAALIALLHANAVCGQQQTVNQLKESSKPEVQNAVGQGTFMVEGTVIDPRHYTMPPGFSQQPTAPATADEHPVADTSAMDAFIAAKNFEASRKPAQAIVSYENAIKAIRTSNANQDEKFKQQVAKAYARLLRKQHNSKLAKQIEQEFCNRK